MSEINTVQIISISISIISLIYTIVFRIREKKKKKFYYIIKNSTVIEKNTNQKDIEIKYKSEKIEKLNQTDILFFNKNSSTIKFQEFGKANFNLEFSQKTKIFDFKIIENNNSNVNFNCEISGNLIKFNFDYFKKGNFVKLIINSDERLKKFPKTNFEFIENDKVVEFNLSKFKLNELKRFTPLVLLSSVAVMFILDYFEVNDIIKYMSLFFTGYIGMDIFRSILSKKIDNRIRQMLTK